MVAAPGGAVTRPRGSRWARRVVSTVAALVAVTAVLLGLGWVLTPSVDNADRRVAAQLSTHGAPVLAGPVPSRVADALIATEDSRFVDNPGVDPISVLRAPFAMVFNRDQGGATLEQQLAKNLYEGGRTGGRVEGAEVVLALKLDRTWTKPEILRMYLDDGYYGHGFYGLTAAVRGYFGEEPGQLDWAQASLLAGLLQAPSAYDPVKHPEVARARQLHVLDRLVAVGTLSRAQADTVAGTPWRLRRG